MYGYECIRIVCVLSLIASAYIAPFFHLRRCRKLTVAEAALLAPAAAASLFGFVAFFTHAVGLNQRNTHTLILVILLISVGAVLLRKALDPGDRGYYRPALLTGLFFGLILLMQFAYPIYTGGFWYFDWWQHYSLSQMYMGKVPHDQLWLGYNFASRTPLLNLNTAFFLSIFGDYFWVYQFVASLLNSLFILPVYLLLKRLSGTRMAVVITIMLLISPSLVHNAWYPWPKFFASYFVLTAAYFYIINRQDSRLPDMRICTLIFTLIWLGFLAHQSSLFPSLVILLDIFLLALRREPPKVLQLGAICIVCFFLLNGIWFYWATGFFGLSGTGLSYYQRQAIMGGIPGYLILSAYHLLAAFWSPLFLYDLRGSHFDFQRFLQNLQAFSYNSVAGCTTFTLFVAALILLLRNILRKRDDFYERFLRSRLVRWSLLSLALWSGLIAAGLLAGEQFGDDFFVRYFNHPEFAREMFIAYFGAAGVAFFAGFLLLRFSARKSENSPVASTADAGIILLYWMAVAAYIGGIIPVRELYIHGTISAGSATAVVLAILFLGRVVSDLPRRIKLLLAIPILLENVFIIWLPLLIHYNGGWADQQNWQLKYDNNLIFLADISRGHWRFFAVAGILLQTAAICFWALRNKSDVGTETMLSEND